MKLHGFSAQVYPGMGIYLVAHITDIHDVWLWSDDTPFWRAAYCLN